MPLDANPDVRGPHRRLVSVEKIQPGPYRGIGTPRIPVHCPQKSRSQTRLETYLDWPPSLLGHTHQVTSRLFLETELDCNAPCQEAAPKRGEARPALVECVDHLVSPIEKGGAGMPCLIPRLYPKQSSDGRPNGPILIIEHLLGPSRPAKGRIEIPGQQCRLGADQAGLGLVFRQPRLAKVSNNLAGHCECFPEQARREQDLAATNLYLGCGADQVGQPPTTLVEQSECLGNVTTERSNHSQAMLRAGCWDLAPDCDGDRLRL
jgi:hypothetical protein